MDNFGTWLTSLTFEDGQYRADRILDPYLLRSGFKELYAIDGIPQYFIERLVTAAQVCDVPHTWRVHQCQSEDQVTDEIKELGYDALVQDIKVMGTHIISYFGKNPNEPYTFLAAGAIRNKLTSSFLNPEFPVVSRAIVAPAHREKGLGSLIVEHRMKIVLRGYFGTRPKAIHFGTESAKILHTVKRVEQEEGIKFVHIGDEQLTIFDGTHTVHDYLCFLPWYQEMILKACDLLETHPGEISLPHGFKHQLSRFMTEGVTGASGDTLEYAVMQAAASLDSSALKSGASSALVVLQELFEVRNKIGARDPK